MVTTERPMTLEEFLLLPEEKPALEYNEDGSISQKVSPKLQHSRLQPKIAEWINRHCEPQRVALAFTELRATYSGASRVPDIAVYLWDRIPVDEDGELVQDVSIPPDIAIEIVSPEQNVKLLVRRCLRFLQGGVQVVLLIDPGDRSIREFRPGSEPMIHQGSDRIDLSDILPGFSFSPQEVFALLRIR